MILERRIEKIMNLKATQFYIIITSLFFLYK